MELQSNCALTAASWVPWARPPGHGLVCLLDVSVESYKKNSTKWFVAKSYALYAEMFRRNGEQSKARENLSRAIEIFKECGADRWVKKYEKELAEI